MADESKLPPAGASGVKDATAKANAAKIVEPGDKPASASFAGFPKTKYHPVYGARDVADPNEEAGLQPAHDWFDSPGEADMHRTDREAQLALHNNRRRKIDDAEAPVVRNSVQATESIAADKPEIV